MPASEGKKSNGGPPVISTSARPTIGASNDGFDNTDFTHPGIPQFSPYAIDTPPKSIQDEKQAENVYDVEMKSHPSYITPSDGAHGHQYEDLTQLAAKIQEDHKINNSAQQSGTAARKKANLFYETNSPSDIQTLKSQKKHYSSSDDICCTRLMIAILCCFVILLLVLLTLVIVGVIKIQDVECTNCNGQGATGSMTADPLSLLRRIEQLERNLTNALSLLNSQQFAVTQAINSSTIQQQTIDDLNSRLSSEEHATDAFNRTMIHLVLTNQTTGSSIEMLQQATSHLEKTMYKATQLLADLNANQIQSEANTSSLWQQLRIVNATTTSLTMEMKEMVDLTYNQSNAMVATQMQILQSIITDVNVTLVQDIVTISKEAKALNSSIQSLPTSNFSLCYSVTYRRESQVNQAQPDQARALVTEVIPEGFVTMGGSCSSEKALHTRLYVNDKTMSCGCSAATSSTAILECYLDMWLCPIG